MKTQDEINKAAEDKSQTITGSKYAYVKGFEDGATFANGYSVEEMCGFAEWRHIECTNTHSVLGAWHIKTQQYASTPDLLKLWEESR